MSVPVALTELSQAVARYGSVAYLLTVGDDQRAHAVSVALEWVGDTLRAPAGLRTRHNAVVRPNVSVLWPPTEAGGYSLIIDADASVDDDAVVLTPRKGVLHRSAAADTACGSDCVPVLGA
jgi:hypothetical protein